MGTTSWAEQSIREMVEEMRPEGGRLPSERELVTRLGAGRTTIRLILLKLVAEGLVRSEHGRGHFVIPRENQV